MNDPITKYEIPDILYRYRSLKEQREFDNLRDLEIFVPSPEKFNDPFDCRARVSFRELANNPELAKKYIDQISGKHKKQIEESGFDFDEALKNLTNLEFLKKKEEEWTNDLIKNAGILCLADRFDEILMWSHYAEQHKGICIGYDTVELSSIGKFSTGGPVKYSNLYPFISLFLESSLQLWEQIFNKSNHWYYEHEYRFVKLRHPNQKVKILKSTIKEIYLGCQISEANKVKIIEIVSKSYPECRVYKMVKSETRFGLNKIEVK